MRYAIILTLALVCYTSQLGLCYEYKTELSETSKKLEKIFKIFQKKLTLESFKNGGVISPTLSRAESNKFCIENAGTIESVASVQNFHISNIFDDYQIPVRLYFPTKRTNTLIIFAHGGGFMHGNLDTHDAICRKIANSFDASVLAVDYRLVPEYKFPTQINDLYSVYSWCLSDKSAHNIGKCKKIILSGDSAGASLCIAVTMKSKDEGLKTPDANILFYPGLIGNSSSKSFELFKNSSGLTETNIQFFLYQYLGQGFDYETAKDNKFINHLAYDFKKFPKTVIISAGIDALLDGHLEMAEKLRKSNVPVMHKILDGEMHGFLSYGSYYEDLIKNTLKEIRGWLKTH